MYIYVKKDQIKYIIQDEKKIYSTENKRAEKKK